MSYLLDTHLLLWTAYTPERLNAITERAKAAMHSSQPMDGDVLP